jgi:hypothetical protein
MEAAEESQSTEASGGLRKLLPMAIPLAAGLVLRLWMLRKLFEVNGDGLVYGGLAKNLLLHRQFALEGYGGELYPTLIRLPGYPIFLAACFRLFGLENYFSATCMQVAIDLLSCWLMADFARRVVPARYKRATMLATLWLAALCPFTASYTPFAIAETLTICTLVLAMWALARFRERPGWGNALLFTFAVTYAALLRPDGALAGVVFGAAMVIGLPVGEGREQIAPRKLMRMATVCIVLALAPFSVWAVRNWNVFHVVQLLAPRLANDPDESANPGWERWVKSWCLDFISTDQIYWSVPRDELKVNKLPSRAFDTPAQYKETVALADYYNTHGEDLTPEIDAQFDHLAAERIAANPLRYYVWLPVGRVADMWLRPRVENLPVDLDWWVYRRHRRETEFSWGMAALNAVYLLLGLAGLLFVRPRFWMALLAYMAVRSALLLTIEAPEARYTVECFPMLIVAGGAALARIYRSIYLSKEKALPGRP